MTTLREAAQQALEALEGGADSWQLVGPAIDALRAALVEDALQKFSDVNQELEAALGCEHCNQPLYAAVKCRVCGRVTEPVKEPVAWIDDSGHPKHLSHLQSATERRLYGPLRPLYTAPPQRKPLTEEEIRDLLEAEFLGRDGKRSWDDDLQVFRLAERAHGIT